MILKPTIMYISHGGGPLPLMGDLGHIEMVACLRQVTQRIARPSAILVISAHWEESVPTLTAGPQPELIYDYAGFPPEAYTITYPCPGEPALAKQVHQALTDAHIRAHLNERRGFDHGLFIPLAIIYPKADIPCIQLSLVKGLNPLEHIAMGRALQELDCKNLLVIGSGFSFHNMKAFFSPVTKASEAHNQAFEKWLIDTCTNDEIDESQRTQQLVDWEKAPSARYCHPREEHLLPLHVCHGLASAPCTDYFELRILNRKASMFLWSPE